MSDLPPRRKRPRRPHPPLSSVGTARRRAHRSTATGTAYASGHSLHLFATVPARLSRDSDVATTTEIRSGQGAATGDRPAAEPEHVRQHLDRFAYEESSRMEIDKLKILKELRERGQDARADWVDRQLPDRVDTHRNAGLLATLGLNLDDLADQPAG